MFNIGPLELGVLALVGLIVLGPERLPQLTKDAARMIRTLREMATGARTQLRNELGPELSDIDLSALRELRNLNPRTALTRALFDDPDQPAAPVNGVNGNGLNGNGVNGNYVNGNGHVPNGTGVQPPANTQAGAHLGDGTPTGSSPGQPPARPLERGESAPFDPDAT